MSPQPSIFRLVSMIFPTVGCLASTLLQGNAAELHVPAAFPSIQAALNAAATGDVVRVAPGTYRENLDFGQKDVSLASTAGAGSTTIDAALGTGVTIGPAGSISGFTIRNARASFGAGMTVRGAGTRIAFNIFEDNAQTSGGYGAAIGLNGASPVIEGNVFRRNTADTQFLSGVISLVNGSSPYIANNIFYNNPCRAINATVPTSASPVIINNTIVGNNVGIRVDRRVTTGNQVYRNNLIHGNGVGFEVDFGTDANNPVWRHNLVSGNGTDYRTISNQTGINGNISGEPLFVDESKHDFKLRRGSPAIDAGENLLAPTRDFENESRPVDGDGDGIAIADIGADELAIGILLVVEGGDVQECQGPEGNTVQVAMVAFPEGLEITSAELFLNGVSVASSLPASVTLPPGSNVLSVVAATADGGDLLGERTVVVADTTAPAIHARFMNRRTGVEMESLDANGTTFLSVKIDVDDACDADPKVESMLGTEVKDGDHLRFSSTDQLRLNTEKLTLKVIATDASGNVAVQTKHLQIRGKSSK